MSGKEKFASVVILSYNSKEDLAECIPSLISQTYQDFEIIVVDNASTDASEEFVRINYPEIKVVQTGKNLGYAAGNNAGFEVAEGEYIVIINPDTVADSKWLAELIKPLENDLTIAATTSKILMYYQNDKINACSTINHYTGLTFCRGLNKPACEFDNYQEVGAVAGCSFAIRRDMLKNIDGFDSEFFLYLEDTDLSWRVRFAGGKIMYAPGSIIFHKCKLSIPPWKEFYLERNRYLILLKNFSSRTLLLLLPALIVTEIVTIGHAVLNGPKYIKSKLQAYLWVIKNINEILTKRHKTICKKITTDREFFGLLDWKIPFEQVIKLPMMSKTVDIVFNSFYAFHMKLISRIV
ncbi:glycosyltransferase family 2 protein [Methanosarcina acetivorans]|uniref:Glycosyltransferase n=1 Tax=Methanosarcina acetivorans (strain ATCC 35395 / DSM 2834 / JCM 12185 / C2A) TaxID=188937 RepID=Q8TNV8_METAC|nr:glycosyltransferase family 2 protein [Methanosarcina acetivorans]AAM05567.1 glycosyltransferase [Methanosarcina acetivorans C2A]